MILQLNKNYLAISLLLLITEILIATYLKTGFIRYTFGDFLAVILLYSFFKSFIKLNSIYLAISVLVFAFIIEFLQLFNLIAFLNLNNNHLAKTILGNTFHLTDLVAYTLGIITVFIVEFKLKILNE